MRQENQNPVQAASVDFLRKNKHYQSNQRNDILNGAAGISSITYFQGGLIVWYLGTKPRSPTL